MGAFDLKCFSERISEQLFGHIMPFWSGPALDHEQGGWMAWLANDLKADRTKPKGLIVNSRILWSFSAVYRGWPEALYRQMADRALDIIMNRFWDAEHGGAFWQLDGDGRVMDDCKKTYGQAFYIYALVEYFRAFGGTAPLARAKELFELIERHAHDGQHGGYWEVRLSNWSQAGAGARLSEKDMNEKKSMNNHLHVLEAWTNLYRVWKDRRVEQRLRELIALFEQRILDRRTQHFHHFFDETWKVRSNTYTFGHDIEGTWLLCEAAEVLGDEALLKQTQATALRTAEAVLQEGIEADGGLCYEGEAGMAIDRGKEWWPQAEAVVGFINAFQISGDAKFLEAAQRVWDFIESHIVDNVHGDWFWRITPEGHVDETQPKVSEWKGPYHSARACLETIHRLQKILAGGNA